MILKIMKGVYSKDTFHMVKTVVNLSIFFQLPFFNNYFLKLLQRLKKPLLLRPRLTVLSFLLVMFCCFWAKLLGCVSFGERVMSLIARGEGPFYRYFCCCFKFFLCLIFNFLSTMFGCFWAKLLGWVGFTSW